MTCRICLEDSESGKLLDICECSGSCQYVHQKCLEQWIDVSRKKSCEICHAVYKHDYQPKNLFNDEIIEQTRRYEMLCIRMVFTCCILGGFLHGLFTGIDSSEGSTFNGGLLLSAFLFNVYHLLIWWVLHKIQYIPEIISFMWLLSFTLGLVTVCFILDLYNDDVTKVFYFNVGTSLIGIFLPCCLNNMRKMTMHRNNMMYNNL